MKNKFISGLLATALCFSATTGNVLTVLADTTETQEISSEAGDTSSQALVTYEGISTYTVTIPKTIQLDTDTKSADYEVTLEADLAYGECVSVVPDSEFTMSTPGKDDVTASVTQNVTELGGYTEVDGEQVQVTSAAGSVTAEDLSAGHFEGTLNFTISLKSTEDDADSTTETIDWMSKDPGMYSEDGTLTMSWSDIISNNYITVSNTTMTGITEDVEGILVIDSSITIIAPSCVKETAISQLYIPDSVTNLNQAVIRDNTSLTYVRIPSTLTNANTPAITGNTVLTAVEWNGTVYTDKATFNAALTEAGIATGDVWID